MIQGLLSYIHLINNNLLIVLYILDEENIERVATVYNKIIDPVDTL